MNQTSAPSFVVQKVSSDLTGDPKKRDVDRHPVRNGIPMNQVLIRDWSFRLIAPDLLGFGRSAKPSRHDYRIGEQADICAAVMAEAGVGRCHVLAHDYGDTVAQELLAEITVPRYERRRFSGPGGGSRGGSGGGGRGGRSGPPRSGGGGGRSRSGSSAKRSHSSTLKAGVALTQRPSSHSST